ncbi:MAG: flagellar basal body P-ring formation protein FlgA, partial [Rhodospirillaceae bacterium]|nr:flagellar basal body P-ring formation protein FlgA [Rhodospirillaceae bacterium]
MTLHVAHRFGFLTSGVILAGLFLTAASTFAADLGTDTPATAITPLPVQLQTSITVDDDLIKLSDIFSGIPASADKPITEAPRPGQRIMLTADWLQAVAFNNGIAWSPASRFERASVFRPSQTVQASDIMAAVKSALFKSGVPESYEIKIRTPMSTLAIPANASKAIAVRDVTYDEAAKSFSAQVEVPAGDPNAYFLQLKGDAFPIVSVPVLKQAIVRDTVITADMIQMVEMHDAKTTAETLIDPSMLIGKASKGYLRSGQPLRANDVYKIKLVNVPVLRGEIRRGTKITDAHINWIEVNADELPSDAIMNADQLIGFAPVRQLASGRPLRITDVHEINMIEIPVAARDVVRGETLSADDIKWLSFNRSDISRETIQNEDGLVGFIVNSGVRAGQPFRTYSVKRPVVIEKGKMVTLVYNVPAMKLTAKAR